MGCACALQRACLSDESAPAGKITQSFTVVHFSCVYVSPVCPQCAESTDFYSSFSYLYVLLLILIRVIYVFIHLYEIFHICVGCVCACALFVSFAVPQIIVIAWIYQKWASKSEIHIGYGQWNVCVCVCMANWSDQGVTLHCKLQCFIKDCTYLASRWPTIYLHFSCGHSSPFSSDSMQSIYASVFLYRRCSGALSELQSARRLVFFFFYRIWAFSIKWRNSYLKVIIIFPCYFEGRPEKCIITCICRGR